MTAETPVSLGKLENQLDDVKDEHRGSNTIASPSLMRQWSNTPDDRHHLNIFEWLAHHLPRPYLPPLKWIPQYTKSKFGCDLNAGMLVAIVVVPQGMAYAVLAGLPPIYGLYTAVVPLFVYALLGTSREIALGPTAMMSLLVSATVGEKMGIDGDTDEAAYIEAALGISLMAGVIQLLLYTFKADQIVNIISHSVLSGFTSGAGLTIFLSQLKYILGIVPHGHSMHYGYEYVEYYIKHPRESCDPKVGKCYSQPATLILGFLNCCFLMGFKKFKARYPPTEDRNNKTVFKVMYKLSDFSALVMVLINILVAYLLIEQAGIELKIVRHVPPGMMTPSVPSVTSDNFVTLITNSIIIAILSFMESYAIGKKFADMANYQMNIGKNIGLTIRHG
jgi:SulP family sulfate permease